MRRITKIKNVSYTLPETRRISIGKKGNRAITSAGGKVFRPPQVLDHFLITHTYKGELGDFVVDRKAHEIIGLKPKSLKVEVMSDDLNEVFPHWFAFYSGSRCLCRGDGEIAIRYENGIYSETDCNPLQCPAYLSRKCYPYGQLHLSLPFVKQIGTVAILRTRSKNSIFGIMGSLTFIKKQTARLIGAQPEDGILAGIELTMELNMKSAEVNGKLQTFPVVSLLFESEDSNMRAIESLKQRLITSQNARHVDVNVLEAPKMRMLNLPESAEEIADIVEEFAPGNIDEEPEILTADFAKDMYLTKDSFSKALLVDSNVIPKSVSNNNNNVKEKSLTPQNFKEDIL
jgi:hypothetical protein